MKTNNQATVPASGTVTVEPASHLSTLLKACMGLFLFCSLMAFVGTVEYSDDVYYSIPDLAFEEITLKLGENATREAIISEYLENTDYYNSLF